ncbi:MAG: deoxyribodipyrimidine photo-lyase [Sinobacteraceae bacterium]|nr:deoxyribodipyrimidine photo-lyase [Nevskiaceae bacterium]
MSRPAAIVWLRQDLRLRNNPALQAATGTGGPVIPVYIWSPEEEGDWAPGSASRWWLHHSLASLDDQLRRRGSRLILAQGPALRVLQTLANDTGATAVYWNKRYEPAAVRCQQLVAEGLRRDGLRTTELNGSLLSDPAEFLNQSGKPYQVYTAFQRSLLKGLRPGDALPAPRSLRSPARWPRTLPLESFGLLPRIKWYLTMETTWQPGEPGAQAALKRFLEGRVADYNRARDIPAVPGTSRLSPHLHFGEIDPTQIWHALRARGGNTVFLKEILWREFAYHLLHHFPQTPTRPLRSEFEQFPWRRNSRLLRAWQRGATGIPLVDAGMRELWATGWMHNRVRMVVGSFLVKNLLIPWQEGAHWFWDTLVDADLANNTLNWQWVGGCGADAAPYFRIFNPETQARRFDPDNRYVRKWVTEPDPPEPLVNLHETREAALDAYVAMRRASKAIA